jgi:RNA polymerase sigma factor (sigma-70 family)
MVIGVHGENGATLARARAGDEDAFRELTDPHRRELQLHCYRILGSVHDAEDLLQETLLAAWRGLEGFQGRASLRSWLYRIATNRCLNALRASSLRADRDRLEPYPDTLLDEVPDRSPGPAARFEAREATELAFIVALQGLAPRQRAVLVLRDVLGFSGAEVARMLDTGEVAIKGALQRARAAVGRERPARPVSVPERELVGRFADAVERGDVDAVVALLTEDARLTMPPLPLVYQGREAIAAFLREREEVRGDPLRLAPTRANTQPAFGAYLTDQPRGLFVLTLEGNAVAAITWFSDTDLFRHFGLPPTLPG